MTMAKIGAGTACGDRYQTDQAGINAVAQQNRFVKRSRYQHITDNRTHCRNEGIDGDRSRCSRDR